MDMTTILGIIIGIGGILLGNVLEGGHLGSLFQFAAAVIVLSGTFGAVMVSSKGKDLKESFRLLKKAVGSDKDDEASRMMREIIEMSKLARRESILAIEPKLNSIRDGFMQNVLRTVVDGVDSKVARQIFENEIEIERSRLMAAAKVWTDAGGFAPTVGIIGAVLGLIHVMGNLTDTSKLGAGIAVAFVATIYGVGFANLIFLPIGNKIKRKISDEMRVKQMILEGGLSIQEGLTPSLIEIKLRSYIEKSR